MSGKGKHIGAENKYQKKANTDNNVTNVAIGAILMIIRCPGEGFALTSLAFPCSSMAPCRVGSWSGTGKQARQETGVADPPLPGAP